MYHNVNLPVESTITYNDLLVNNLSDELPPLALTAEDSDGDTQIVAALDLNDAKILNNKTVNTVTLDVPVPQIRLTDVYAKDVTIPLEFRIVPPVVTYFNLVRYPIFSSGSSSSAYRIGASEVIGTNINSTFFNFNDSNNALTLFGNESDVINSNDQYIFIQIGYMTSGFAPLYYRIILDVVRGSQLTSQSTYNNGRGYTVDAHSYYYYSILPNAYSVGSYWRVTLDAFGNIPGRAESDKKLFLIYDDSYDENPTNDNDNVGAPYYNESAVLRLSPEMVSFAEWFN